MQKSRKSTFWANWSQGVLKRLVVHFWKRKNFFKNKLARFWKLSCVHLLWRQIFSFWKKTWISKSEIFQPFVCSVEICTIEVSKGEGYLKLKRDIATLSPNEDVHFIYLLQIAFQINWAAVIVNYCQPQMVILNQNIYYKSICWNYIAV